MAHGTPHPLRPLRAVAPDAARVAVATRQPLRAALERAGLHVVAESPTARDLVADAVRDGVAACVLGADLPERDWALRTLHAALPDAAIVLVGRAADDQEITAALAAGAAAYVTAPVAAAEAVTLALAGQAVLPRDTATRLARRARWEQPQPEPRSPAEDGALTPREREVLQALRDGATTAEIAAGLGLSAVTVRRHLSGLRRKAGGSLEPTPEPYERTALTARELQVLRLAAAGRGNHAIAAELYITPSTVKNHLTRIMAKLGARNRTEAAVLAARQGHL